MKKEREHNWSNPLIFCILLAAASAVTFILFYRQTTAASGVYQSDMKAYILEMQGLDSGYSFPYPVFFRISAFLNLFMGPETAVALATMMLNSLGMVIVKLILDHLLLSDLQAVFPRQKWMAGAFLGLAAVSLFFISMLFPPTGIYLPGIKYTYLGVFTANPFHNATYMAARPFAVLAFFWYVRLLDTYEKGWKGQKRDYVLFSLFLLLATMTKPSFTIVLVGAAGLIMAWRLIRDRFRSFVPAVQLGLCFVPTFIDLLYQYRGVFVPTEGEEGGVGFTLGGVWRLYCDNIPLAICLAVGFPLLVLALNYRQLKKSTLFRFSWQLYIMSFIMAFFLYEKGFRDQDFNFSWGYMYGIFFCFAGALIVLIKATASKKRPALLAAQWAAYLWHLVCGLYYFWGIFQGNMYY
nr:hypothetical protein [uncultured Acetatifactor sp.]